MARRRSFLLTLVGSLALIAAACGPSTPAAPALTDPIDILVKSAETLSTTKTVHIEVAVSGSVNVDLMGTGTTSAFPLDGTTATADVDVVNKNAKATFAAPGLLGINGELIQVGTTSYVKTSLTGAKYQKQEGLNRSTHHRPFSDSQN